MIGTALVTGATGFLGPHLAGELRARGCKVIALERDRTRAGGQDGISWVFGSVEDGRTVARAIAEYEVDTVFHLAAQSLVGVAQKMPVETFESNIKGTWTLLEACRLQKGIRKVIVASSDKAYGSRAQPPYTEDAPLLGRNPYDASKACMDILSQMYAESYDLPVSIVRCGNIYGGGDLNWNRIVPGTIRSVLHGQRPVIRSNGRLRRDYLYVRDAVSAYIATAERGQGGEAYNFGTDKPTSVLELVATILSLMESKLEPDVRNETSGEIPDQWLLSLKARTHLSWKPEFNLGSGLTETIAWYRGHLKEDKGYEQNRH